MSMNHSQHRSYPIKIRVAPRKNRGAMDNKLIGDNTTKIYAPIMITPTYREWQPDRYVKIVWEKIYEPVDRKRAALASAPEEKVNLIHFCNHEVP